MKKEYEILLSPWKIGSVEIKNRLVLPSMGGTNLFGWMEAHHFDTEGARFLLEVARNEVGLLLPGCQPVYNPMFGRWFHKSPQRMFDQLAQWLPDFHQTGAKLFIQLTAGFGRSFTVSPLMEMPHFGQRSMLPLTSYSSEAAFTPLVKVILAMLSLSLSRS